MHELSALLDRVDEVYGQTLDQLSRQMSVVPPPTFPPAPPSRPGTVATMPLPGYAATAA